MSSNSTDDTFEPLETESGQVAVSKRRCNKRAWCCVGIGIAVAVVLIVVLAGGGVGIASLVLVGLSGGFLDAPPHDMLAALPFSNASYISHVSKFQSCDGYDSYSLDRGLPYASARVHTFCSESYSLTGLSPDDMVLQAPFDGSVLKMDKGGNDHRIVIKHSSGCDYEINTITLDSSLSEGDSVTAGQRIGQAPDGYVSFCSKHVVRCDEMNPFRKTRSFSMFNHLGANAYASILEAAGLALSTPKSDFSITDEYRTEHECQLEDGANSDNPELKMWTDLAMKQFEYVCFQNPMQPRSCTDRGF